ncbi:hypothetical protein GWK47_013788 [Chionoecetes opilio]|uniref:Uncharacterized protein n=1 Tax=Chionoecetes opilio TaxID=41210 RepID=A0A8J4XU35_CHIOP|nr:hypothetical protein GWK47_013788 [Chionoecetes opilio]
MTLQGGLLVLGKRTLWALPLVRHQGPQVTISIGQRTQDGGGSWRIDKDLRQEAMGRSTPRSFFGHFECLVTQGVTFVLLHGTEFGWPSFLAISLWLSWKEAKRGRIQPQGKDIASQHLAVTMIPAEGGRSKLITDYSLDPYQGREEIDKALLQAVERHRRLNLNPN